MILTTKYEFPPNGFNVKFEYTIRFRIVYSLSNQRIVKNLKNDGFLSNVLLFKI